eukprot:383750-Pyramimonas_sp.AAC.1
MRSFWALGGGRVVAAAGRRFAAERWLSAMVRCDGRIEDLFAGAIGSRSRTRSIEEQNTWRKRRNRLAPRQVVAPYVPPWRCARPMEVARPTRGE